MVARLLPLLLALCTLLPTELRARMLEACRERDECCCRRDEKAAPPGPTARRVDCCEAPCAIEHTSSAAALSPRRDISADAGVTVPPVRIVSASSRAIVEAPPRRGRDPPLRIHALTQRWLL